MKRLILIALILNLKATAQNWKPLGTGFFDSTIPLQLYADTANNNLFTFGTDTNVFTNNVLQNWYTSSGVLNVIGNNGVMPFFNKKNLHFKFYYLNSDILKPRTSVIRFSNETDLDTLTTLVGDWSTNGYTYYNGKLTIVMGSSGGATVSYNGLAQFDGISFSTIGKSSWGISEGYPQQCAVFNNELYAAGDIDSSLQVLKPTGWKKVSPGIHGANKSISKLLVYNNRLYVIGGFWKSENQNNPGNSIAAWNGISWDSLGGGASNQYVSLNGGFDDAVVCGGKLYLVGAFTSVSGVKGKRIMCWNDTSWCWLGKDLESCSGRLWRIECLNDTLYATGDFGNVGTKNLGVVAKLFNMNLTDSCSSSIYSGINDSYSMYKIGIYPNPVSNTLLISSEYNFVTETKIEITNCLGQTVLKLPYSKEIDVSGIDNGCYILQITTKDNQQYHSKFIKQ